MENSVLTSMPLSLRDTPQALSKDRLELSAWLVYWDGGATWRAFEKYAFLFSRICPQWYHCNAAGRPAYAQGVSVEQRHRTQFLAQQHGVRTMAMVNNYGQNDFDPERMQAFLKEPNLRQSHAEELVELAKRDNADGLDIDYENLWPQQRDLFCDFMRRLAQLCKRETLLLAVAVHPKTSDSQCSPAAQAQDYARLGAWVDYFRPMCYDFHWSTSTAGPISPLSWVEEVLNYTRSQVPAAKVELGIPGYGYDWLDQQAQPLNWASWQDLLQNRGPAERDAASGELVLRYQQRTAYFVDATALQPKLNLAQKFKIRGLALWTPGSVDPAFWDLVQQQRSGKPS